MKIFLKRHQKLIFFFTTLILVSGVVLFFPKYVYAGIGTQIAQVIGWILYPIIWVMGKLAVLLLQILVGVAQYNKFIESSAVTYGWILVRDLCNMFFVLILLVIAFATILRIESYNLKTWLPKLIIMAILINFSKMICGVFIDFAQVIMLTFVNAFKDIAGANLTEMLGLTKILEFNDTETDAIDGWSILGSIILGLIFIIISVVVILTMLMMLVIRMIMIWIYVVLSPLAYLLASFPQGQSYSQRWWSDFSKNLIIGPILAFFIWLSFASLGGVQGSGDLDAMKSKKEIAEDITPDSSSATITEAGSYENMLKFIISIGMLVGGLMIAQEMGGMAGKVAGKGMAKLQAMGAGSLKLGKRAAGSLGRRTAEAGLKGAGKMDNKVGKFAKGWSQDLKDSRVKRGVQARENIATKLGMSKNAAAAGQELTGDIKRRFNDMRGKGRDNIEQGQKDIATGQTQVSFGENLKIEGNVDLKKAEDLKNAQDNFEKMKEDYLKVNPSGNEKRDFNPERREARKNLNEAKQQLDNLKADAGLSTESTKDEVLDKAEELETEGNRKIAEGNQNITDGQSTISGGRDKIAKGEKIQDKGLGNFLVGYTDKTFKKMNSDYNDAKDLVSNIAKKEPDLERVSSSNFSDLGGNLNTKQKAVWDNLNQNNPAAANLNSSVSSLLSKSDLSKEEISKVNSISEGLSTYKKASGGKLSPELGKLETIINRDNRVEKVDESKAGKYRLTGSNKGNRGMNIDDSGIGSINEFGRDKGKSDTISYNFDKLKSKGIDINEKAEGVYLEGDVKNKVKVEIISDIDKELKELRSKVSAGGEMSAKDSRREKILESSKKRLNNGDNFSLVNANKGMGLSEAAITQRHEGAHQELDEKRKLNNFTPNDSHKKQEEELVEHYGNKAREVGVNHKVADSVVADIIFEGQKKGASSEEIKVNINKEMDGYKAARQKEVVSNIINKEKQVIINNEKSGGSQGNFVSDTRTTDAIKDLSGEIKNSLKDIKGIKGDIKATQAGIRDIKTAQGIKGRLDTFRYSRSMGAINKKK